jgi:flagellar P-ring protein precursor FlgI
MKKFAFILVALLALSATPAYAVKVADITRLSGQRSNLLTGLRPGLRPQRHGRRRRLPAGHQAAGGDAREVRNPATVSELYNANNVAIVSLVATVPGNGVRDGDKLDVYVMSNGAAKSLKGGRLYVTPMQGPLAGSGIFALARARSSSRTPARRRPAS